MLRRFMLALPLCAILTSPLLGEEPESGKTPEVVICSEEDKPIPQDNDEEKVPMASGVQIPKEPQPEPGPVMPPGR